MVKMLFRPRLSWFGFLLLVLLMMSMVWSIDSAHWVTRIPSIEWLAIASLGGGFLLAKSKLPWFLAHLLATLVGTSIVAYLGTSLIDRGLLWDKLIQLIFRVNAWGYAARTGGINNDSLPFVVILLLITWLIGYNSAWSVFRTKGVWWAIVPSGIAILINLSYAPKSLFWYLLVYLFSAILLAVQMNYVLLQQKWKENELSYTEHLGLSFFKNAVLVGVVIMLVAWFVPTAEAVPSIGDSLSQLSGPWRNFEGDFNRLFASVASRERPFSNDFGSTLALRSGINLSSNIAMKVFSDDPHYWRGITYDNYTGQGWLSSTKDKDYLPAFSSTGSDEQLADQKIISQKVVMESPKNDLFFSAGLPVRLDYPVSIEHDQGAPRSEVTAAKGIIAIRPGQTYNIESSISTASVQELRQSGLDYPQWIKDKYLQLPRSLPKRVQALAQQLTSGRTNPYDMAEAIEDYLRKLTYDQNVGDLPHDRDMVDFFLFSTRKGYCDYFSTSMAVMLRTIGVPARVVAGYMTGTYDDSQGAYIVKESDAHSWTEAYFPGYGWVEFEPTASNPRFVRPLVPPVDGQTDQVDVSSNDTSVDSGDLLAMEDESPTGPVGYTIPWQIFWSIAAAFFGVFLLWSLWSKGLAKLVFEMRVYEQVCRLSRLTRIGPKKHETPLEFAGRIKQSMPEGAESIELIANAYVNVRYGRKTLDDGEREGVKRAWTDLSRRMIGRLWRLGRSK